jgi:hypothetical protein
VSLLDDARKIAAREPDGGYYIESCCLYCDRNKQALCRALEKRRAQLDTAEGLTSVALVLKLDSRTGRPRELLFRSEASDDLRNGLPG